MHARSRLSHIWQEILCHLPFTAAGASAGIIFMLIFKDIGGDASRAMFSVFHPLHVVLSAMVTTSLFALHTRKKNVITYLLIGYVGSVGVATISDSVIPFIGEEVMGISVPTESAQHELMHGHEEGHDHGGQGHELHSESCEHGDHSGGHGLHLGFIEEWYIVNPAAVLGIAIAWFLPRSRFPHALHILISTWASSAHMLMNTQIEITSLILFGMFFVLFIAVWVPCCISDIVFPLLFARGDIDVSCRCGGPRHHHEEKQAGEQ
ncbi:MAG: hypothetical protein JW745_04670 [Sedimentisphaerales bacterium]|nr:hypothetical protein [Sedimentisphaerales bacterium]MBN2841631.1 hypothetical protein [Sedimentisphaerales bacterium]